MPRYEDPSRNLFISLVALKVERSTEGRKTLHFRHPSRKSPRNSEFLLKELGTQFKVEKDTIPSSSFPVQSLVEGMENNQLHIAELEYMVHCKDCIFV